jgi:hypothetical protein
MAVSELSGCALSAAADATVIRFDDGSASGLA